jgi:drug/metabolite transporter (DMT)-like permease
VLPNTTRANHKAYILNSLLFVLGIYSNMRSLATANVETVIIFRACSPLAVSLCDWVFLNRELPSFRSWFALSTIAIGNTVPNLLSRLLGTCIRTRSPIDRGYRLCERGSRFLLAWAGGISLAYIIFCDDLCRNDIVRTHGLLGRLQFQCPSSYNITSYHSGKVIMSELSFKSMWAPTFYTNLFAVLPMVLLGYGSGEFLKLRYGMLAHIMNDALLIILCEHGP